MHASFHTPIWAPLFLQELSLRWLTWNLTNLVYLCLPKYTPSLVRPTTEFLQFKNFHSYFCNESNKWPWYPSWKCLMNDYFDIFLGMFCWFFLLSVSFPLPSSKIFWLSCVWISYYCWNGSTITNQTKIKIFGSIWPVKFPQFGALASTTLFLVRLVLKH